MNIKLQFYKHSLYILSEFDITQNNLDEYKLQLKKLTKQSQMSNGDMHF